MCISRRRRNHGFTLLELLVLVIVVAPVAVGVTRLMQESLADTANALPTKQALAVAEAYLEEVLAQPFAVNGGKPAATQANRPAFDDMRDYDGFVSTGIYTRDGVALPGLAAYSVAISVVDASTDATAQIGAGVAATDILRARVTVSGPASVQIALDGYRVSY